MTSALVYTVTVLAQATAFAAKEYFIAAS